ncbi:hypothetical protein [Helicobacter cetorum]|nr:hypothetical protein [Helicobacter cetorum]
MRYLSKLDQLDEKQKQFVNQVLANNMPTSEYGGSDGYLIGV